jgi:hypothetical protein
VREAHPDVDAYISALDPRLAALARALRDLVTTAVPHAAESIKWGHLTYQAEAPFCYIKAFPRHVNLGFWRGAALDDPAGIVRISGQQMGRVRVISPVDIAPEVLMDLVRQAAALNALLGTPARTR